MKLGVVGILMGMVLVCGGALAAETAQTQSAIRLRIETRDGSRLVGEPSERAITLVGVVGKVLLPWERTAAVSSCGDGETFTVELENGDRMTGVLSDMALRIRTVFGDVAVPLSAITAVSVVAGADSDDLVLHYTFDQDRDGKVFDSGGMGHHGRLAGGVQYEGGIKGRAPRFTDRSTYIVCDDKGMNADEWPGVTVSVWVLMRGYSTYGSVIGRGEVTGGKAGGFGLSIGGPYGNNWIGGSFGVYLGASDHISAATRTFAPGVKPYPKVGEWFHLVGAYDGRTMRCYVNGVLERSLPLSKTGLRIYDDPVTKLVIGTCPISPYIDWYDQFFNGLLDELRVYKRGLSPAQIRSLYREIVGKSPAAMEHPDEAKERMARASAARSTPPLEAPILYYPFDDDGGEMVYDQTGKGRNARNNGATLIREGIRGAAYEIGGGANHISLPAGAVSNLPCGTLTAWVKLPPAGQRIFCDIAASPPEEDINVAFMSDASGKLVACLGKWSASGTIVSDAAVPLNQWTFIGFTWTTDDAAIFINGQETARKTDLLRRFWIPPAGTSFMIGRDTRGIYDHDTMTGAIDEVMIYNRALSGDDMRRLFESFDRKVKEAEKP